MKGSKMNLLFVIRLHICQLELKRFYNLRPNWYIKYKHTHMGMWDRSSVAAESLLVTRPLYIIVQMCYRFRININGWEVY